MPASSLETVIPTKHGLSFPPGTNMICFLLPRVTGLTIGPENGNVRRADGVGREVGVGEHDLVAVSHLSQDLEEVGRDDG